MSGFEPSSAAGEWIGTSDSRYGGELRNLTIARESTVQLPRQRAQCSGHNTASRRHGLAATGLKCDALFSNARTHDASP